MIYSFEANLFGPGTQPNPDNLRESILAVFRHTGRKTALLVNRVGDDRIDVGYGTFFSYNDLESLPIIAIVRDLPSSVKVLSAKPALVDKLRSLDDIKITDYFDGRDETGQDVATNFPLLRTDWCSSGIFNTGLPTTSNSVVAPVNLVKRVGREHFISAANVVYRKPDAPLYQDGRVLRCSTEPFGQWPENDENLSVPSRTIRQPVLYLAHPFSTNYNIFLHETILSVLELKNLSDETIFLVRTDAFRLDFLSRLGVPSHRILPADVDGLILQHVLVPIRRLNLKYLGPVLYDMYYKLRNSLVNDVGSVYHASELVYVDRKRAPQNTGANRYIINNDEIIDFIKRRSGSHMFLEDLSLTEKFRNLSGSGTVVTAVGANLVNVALALDIKRIILISTPLWGHFTLYWAQLLRVQHPAAQITVFDKCDVEDNGLSSDPFNKPFRVDVNALAAII